jgi:hypothetical protein
MLIPIPHITRRLAWGEKVRLPQYVYWGIGGVIGLLVVAVESSAFVRVRVGPASEHTSELRKSEALSNPRQYLSWNLRTDAAAHHLCQPKMV